MEVPIKSRLIPIVAPNLNRSNEMCPKKKIEIPFFSRSRG
jgi:hypothetical protein